jgi:amino acid adenylation domain-containing protein
MLGVLKAGGGYVSLDPRYPADRLRFMLADVGAAVLVTHAATRDAVPACDALAVVDLDHAASELAAERTEPLANATTPDNLAYVIYTSGSTGTPKGTQVEHRQVVRLFRATEAWFDFGADVWTLFHSSAFDFSVWEMWGALLYGGRLVVVPYDVSRDPEAFHALVSREGVTVLNQTPSAFRQFVEADAVRGGALALRLVIFGGEALEPAGLRAWVQRHGTGRPRLVNMYGITETTVHVTYRPLSHADVFAGTGSPIGARIPDLRIYVLDAARQPVPVGIPGELFVGGGGVARGYLHRPALTAARFVPDPFGSEPGARLYRTGDRGRWLADGTLEYQGRIDAQVKIRGFRIEPQEVEARLLECDGVRACAVVLRADGSSEKRLVAYVVAGATTHDDLRAHLRRTLPDYMVPAAFVSLDALPLTAHGKLDLRALPAPLADTDAAAAPPRTPLEEQVVEVWRSVLGVSEIGVHQNFFDLGGNSLLLYRVYSQLREIRSDLQVVDLFRYTTVEQLAVYLGARVPQDSTELATSRSRGAARSQAVGRRGSRSRIPKDIIAT